MIGLTTDFDISAYLKITCPLPCVIIPCQSSPWFSWCEREMLSVHANRAMELPLRYHKYWSPQDEAQQIIIKALINCGQNIRAYLSIWLYAFAVESSHYILNFGAALEISKSIIAEVEANLTGLRVPNTYKLLPGYISTPEQVINIESYLEWAAQNILAMLERYVPVLHTV